MSVLVSRDLLGLTPLQINDHLTYAVAAPFLGGTVTWNRTQVSSPMMDGDVTTFRRRPTVTETVTVEVMAGNQADLHSAISQLVLAFQQDAYTVTITLGGEVYAYRCESADFAVAWVGARFIAHQLQVTLSVPRSPVSFNSAQVV